ncbi:MAG: HAD-IIB family hydrolase [Deltaproteobacteria bacterium]|nr:MAG: HAD-IIB family hydrolase [Deltaproteobacteria bacterium]
MRYLALATDYDGTLAEQGTVRPQSIAAVERLRKSGRRAVLVTGREFQDLQTVFDRFDLFDLVVAENGALLYRPQTREEVMLAEPPPPQLAERLRERGATPVGVGRVIVATREPHEVAAVEAVRELGLEWQVIFNKGAVMLLPSGVNKQTGLATALSELGLRRGRASRAAAGKPARRDGDAHRSGRPAPADRRPLRQRQDHCRHRLHRAPDVRGLSVLHRRSGRRLRRLRRRGEHRDLRTTSDRGRGRRPPRQADRARRSQPRRRSAARPAIVLRGAPAAAAGDAHAHGPPPLDRHRRGPPSLSRFLATCAAHAAARPRRRPDDHRAPGTGVIGDARGRRHGARGGQEPGADAPALRSDGARGAARWRSPGLVQRPGRAASAGPRQGAAPQASPQVRGGEPGGRGVRVPRAARQAQAAGAEPGNLPPDGRRRGRRDLDAPPRPARLFEVVPDGDQGRRPGRGCRADRGQRRSGEPQAHPGRHRKALHAAGVGLRGPALAHHAGSATVRPRGAGAGAGARWYHSTTL